MEAISISMMVYGFIINICLILRLRYPFPAVLLIFVPFVNLFALGAFAFRRSPIEEELANLRERIREMEIVLNGQRVQASIAPSAPSA